MSPPIAPEEMCVACAPEDSADGVLDGRMLVGKTVILLEKKEDTAAEDNIPAEDIKDTVRVVVGT